MLAARHLKDNLKIPFRARYESDGSSLIIRRPPEPRQYDRDEEYGLLCEARSREGLSDVPRAELDGAGPGNRKRVRNYGFGFGNSR